MKLIAAILVIVFVSGIVGACIFWPAASEQKSTAFFSILQFVAAFALILLTFPYVVATRAYVAATQEQLADQNKEPKITIVRFDYPQSDPFTVRFEIELANPSVRATSLSIRSIQIGEVFARESYFELDQTRRERITIPARDLLNVTITARNFDPRVPVELGRRTKTLLIFDDVFHGTLSPAVTEV